MNDRAAVLGTNRDGPVSCGQFGDSKSAFVSRANGSSDLVPFRQEADLARFDRLAGVVANFPGDDRFWSQLDAEFLGDQIIASFPVDMIGHGAAASGNPRCNRDLHFKCGNTWRPAPHRSVYPL